jgi:DNA-binding CsgD family transcriptional regulator
MESLLERDDELAALGDLVDRALDGHGSLVQIEGDAGIGKTAIAATACELALRRGLTVVSARGAELERELAFGAARDLLAPAVGAVSGAAGPATVVLSSRAPATQGHDLFAVLHGLYWCVADMAAHQPLLIVVDDVHWCDVPSLRFLAYLARRLDGLPVAMLIAGRPVTLDPPRRELLDAMAREPNAYVVRPAPLSASGVRALIVRALGAPESRFEEACHTATGGNPFLLGELLADLRAAGTAPLDAEVERVAAAVPREVERSVRLRLTALMPESAALARAAAVLGAGADPRRAAELAGLPPGATGPAVDALVAARLLAPGPGLTFLHPLLQSAVSASQGPFERAEAHRRAVVVLAAAGVTGDTLVPHLLAARPVGDPEVVDALREAAARATARGVPEGAAHLLRRALDEPPCPTQRPGILAELGVAAMRSGDPTALDYLIAATAEAPDPGARGRATLVLARGLLHSGRGAEAVRRCVDVLEELAGEDPVEVGELMLELDAELVTIASQDADTRPVAEERWRLREREPDPGTRGGCVLLAALALEGVITGGSRMRVLRLAEQALTGGHLLREPVMARLPSVGISLTLAGQPVRAMAMWDEVIRTLRLIGDVRGFALASAFRGYAAHHAGDLRAALADTRVAVELTENDPSQALTRGFAVAWLADGLLDTGELDAADELLAVHAPLAVTGGSASSYLRHARGRLRLAQHRPEEAEQDIRECGRRLGAAGSRNDAVFRWRSTLALALHQRGELIAARAAANEALRAAESWGAPLPLAESLRVAGQVGSRADALPLLRHAVEVAAEVPLERARALVALGTALRHNGARTEAREALRDALDAAVDRGATAIAKAAQDELVATGARPRRRRTSGADALTPTERRVVEMAANGMTNRAVAQALFVGEKTVETHLGHAYRKLGITARSQLHDALTAPPVPDSRTPPGSDDRTLTYDGGHEAREVVVIPKPWF